MNVMPYASVAVVAVGSSWGLYWLPLRELEAVAKIGPWATLAVTLVAAVALAPVAWLRRENLRAAGRPGLASVALGGASFVLYSNGLLYGHVAVVILLFYLTPVWSTLIARFWLGWRISWWRYAALVLGLGGIALVLRASSGELPLPYRLGDWLGLASGLAWSIASTGIHLHSRTAPLETNFVFCAGAVIGALMLALLLGWGDWPAMAPDVYVATAGWVVLIGVVWWAVLLTLFVGATQQLEPARVGILLLSEALVGALSAALLTDEPFGALMAVGMVLVLAAGAVESLPERRRDASPLTQNP
jgi:drug/metabolite transporter (DMT)-like permease